MPHRYALYFTPQPLSDWWEAGSQWLGRCALKGTQKVQPPVAGMSPRRLRELTAEPRRYGWHATLKAPFVLAPHVSPCELTDTVERIAQQHRCIPLDTASIAVHNNFMAFTLGTPLTTVDALASDAVQQLAPLAQPLTTADIARRRRAPLTTRQDQLMLRWGYPYVLDEFQFHMTLSNSLKSVPPSEQYALLDAAQQHFAALPALQLKGIAICVEDEAGADFRCLSYHHLASV